MNQEKQHLSRELVPTKNFERRTCRRAITPEAARMPSSDDSQVINHMTRLDTKRALGAEQLC